jgi:hypothetical protein
MSSVFVVSSSASPFSIFLNRVAQQVRTEVGCGVPHKQNFEWNKKKKLSESEQQKMKTHQKKVLFQNEQNFCVHGYGSIKFTV